MRADEGLRRWEFELRIITPDDQVLQVKQSFADTYMDGSVVEAAISEQIQHAKRCLERRGYFNG